MLYEFAFIHAALTLGIAYSEISPTRSRLSNFYIKDIAPTLKNLAEDEQRKMKRRARKLVRAYLRKKHGNAWKEEWKVLQKKQHLFRSELYHIIRKEATKLILKSTNDLSAR